MDLENLLMYLSAQGTDDDKKRKIVKSIFIQLH